AVDAAVTAALVAGVVAVPSCGIGGYGGHMVIGRPDGKVSAIDFNSAAPEAARADMFPRDEKGFVKGGINVHGWLAAGVPGTLAGMQLALDKFGAWSMSSALKPAVRYARGGFPITARLAKTIATAAGQFQKDPGSLRLFLSEGKPLPEGATFRNPDLADMLQQLADANSVKAFYRGEIAQKIAAEFRKNGGLVTASDLAQYEACEVAPLVLEWNGRTIYTAPLTAGGLTVIQALTTLKALGWEKLDANDPKTTHSRLEAVRLAWHDRLTLLGDPQKVDVPVSRLLSKSYADAAAERVRKAVADGKALPANSDGRKADGTIHITAVDSRGMMVALTLTHGESFGAQVTVDGLGLVLGHGMSRFDPNPKHPNCPGPAKRPLHNMCPTVVLHDGKPIAAMGTTGGRRIPNTLFDVLSNFVGLGQPLKDAAAAPRLHTIGNLDLDLSKNTPAAIAEYLKKAGYNVKTGPGANFNGIARDPKTAEVTGTAG
ncbi:MAG TPA: gamma-glutamyltransferase, partial [Gemmataceae bacterium]|nr:gamma-glutamyltransferase [Gemmataceae bacterium]